jgi:hypothetical protein
MAKWDYRVVVVGSSEDLEAVLKRAGAQGWELVSVIDKGLSAHLILKRPVAG